MKKTVTVIVKNFIILTFLLLLSHNIFATTFYVGKSGVSDGNYFTNIQSAVNAATDGDTVIVSNGIYVLNSEIDVDKNLTIQSVSGAEKTIVDGNGANRCFNLYNHSTVISGFTITNGYTGGNNGGGVQCSGTTPLINNCIIVGNSVKGDNGSGFGGAVIYGTVNNCMIFKNFAGNGGAICASIANNCAIYENTAYYGGATYEAVANNCTITRNTANLRAGASMRGTIRNSIVYYNEAPVNPNRQDGTYSYCCTTTDSISGTGNISSEPMLLSYSHIATNSPCIGAGAWSYISGTDIDGEAWKNLPSIGCDEVYANAISGNLSVAISADKTCNYAGKSITFSADIFGKLTHSIWTFDDGTAETNKIQVTHSWNSIGEFNVILTTYNDTYPGGVSNLISIQIITNIYYVNINNTNPAKPYSTWETAATNIQDAVDIALDDGEIFVTNGYYLLDSAIYVNKYLKIRSINGAEYTIIDGNNKDRCFYLDNCYITLISGFTITNGLTDDTGGGVFCSCTIPRIYDCVISGNTAGSGGGIRQGDVRRCIISGNNADNYGGGAYSADLNNCTVVGNSARYGGGGVAFCNVNNSVISGNSADDYAGGAFDGTLNNCIITENSAVNYGGGTHRATVNNSIVRYNSAAWSTNRDVGTYNYCCTTPDATNGIGNISVEPMLISLSHIATNSPCIGAGFSNYVSGVDIDGEAWKNPPSIGCDEVYANANTGLLTVAIIAEKNYVYVGESIILLADINGRPSQNIWTFDDGTAETNKYQVSHIWNSLGEYNVVLTAFNKTYSNGVSASLVIKVVTNINYVNVNNISPVEPYDSWETAATNIQDAVDVAKEGGTIIITNGTYVLGSQITINKDISIQSVNGLESTIIDGNNSNRCFYLYNNNIIISRFTILNGNAIGSNGGGLYCCGTNPVIRNCTIANNHADITAGGIYKGTICNSEITGNSAENGGGTYNSIVNNSTIVRNLANNNGGGTYGGTINNSIIYYNSAKNDSNQHVGILNYCCITPKSSGTGNIDAPPQFTDTNSFDYRLKSTSPCINAGNNSYAPMPWDLDGNPRIFDNVVDMGCYEFQYFTPRIDSNALIFPAVGSELIEDDFTNIIWDVERIFDNGDKTNLTITKISLLDVNSSNEMANVTNDISNLSGEISWLIPEGLADSGGSYVLEFEVVNSSSITNSRILTDNEFVIIPEPVGIWILGLLYMLSHVVACIARENKYRNK